MTPRALLFWTVVLYLLGAIFVSVAFGMNVELEQLRAKVGPCL